MSRVSIEAVLRVLLVVCVATAMIACDDAPAPVPRTSDVAAGEPSPATPTPAPAAETPAQGRIVGEAFIKLHRGTDKLAGMPVQLYPGELLERMEKIRAEHGAATAERDRLYRRTQLLQDAERMRRDAAQWDEVAAQVQALADEFEKYKYTEMKITHPLTGEVIELSWESDKRHWSQIHLSQMHKEVLAHRDKVSAMFGAALEEAGIEEPDLENELALARSAALAVRVGDASGPAVLAAAAGMVAPLQLQLVDSGGNFAFEGLGHGRYAIVASYTEPDTADEYRWVIEAVVDSTEEKVVLSQSNAYLIVQRRTPEKEEEAKSDGPLAED